ncbi:DnaA ATPase domain-containing protein [Streptomyces sp. enrichment culture]|uniref:DnaA ATPase domain-containing protein n=1 Tax=Streptomyces sp. enrichment culture TaxID=1795815 RepID=UPI003F542942
MSSEEFTNEFINAIRDGKGDSFRKRYREMVILLVDDPVPGGQGVDAGGVLPHLQHPPQRQQQTVLTTDVQPPELESRIAILRKKSVQEQLNAPPELLEFIASRISRNIRGLEGALIWRTDGPLPAEDRRAVRRP